MPVSARTAPLAVRRMTGIRLAPLSTPASRAVCSDKAVTVAPLSTSIRRSTPLTLTRAQKWPSAAIAIRTSRPRHFLIVEAKEPATRLRLGS